MVLCRSALLIYSMHYLLAVCIYVCIYVSIALLRALPSCCVHLLVHLRELVLQVKFNEHEPQVKYFHEIKFY